MSRRVVITGMGVKTCNGNNIGEFWDNVKNGVHGIATSQRLIDAEHATTFCGEVKMTNTELAGEDKKDAKRKDRFVLLGISAAIEAMKDSGLDTNNWEDPFKVGCIIGAGIGGLSVIEQEYKNFIAKGARRVSAMLIPKMIIDSLPGDISIKFGAKGPNYSIATACATGSHCIGAAFQQIKYGTCDIAITGGAEASICDLGLSGFNNMKALSTRNDSPGTASRPFDKNRNGFIMAEGAGILILEELEKAKARGATIHGEIVGYGATGDAFHETKPNPEGVSGQACMKMALDDAGINPEEMDYINAHGTSTKFNDMTETMIIKKVFGEQARKMAINSTKSMTGHTLGAAGGVEAIATLLSLKEGVLHPTINYETPDPDCDLDYVPNTARENKNLKYALSNNLGFGGHNASVIFKKFEG